jgi:hypothetical protein
MSHSYARSNASRRRRSLPIVLAALVLTAACSGDDDEAAGTTTADETATSTGSETSDTAGDTADSATDDTDTTADEADTDDGAATTTTTRPSTTAGSTTTAAGGSTASTTTTPAGGGGTGGSGGGTATTPPADGGATPTTTLAPPASDAVVLRPDGLGRLAFGGPAAAVVDGLAAQLGAPIVDETEQYPVRTDEGFAIDEFGDVVFAHPVGRAVCFENGLCAQFGGTDAGSLAFVGWTYAGVDEPALTTPSGATTESRWSDFPAMTVDDGGCFSEGTGRIDGVELVLVSEGAPFGDIDEDGNMAAGDPTPAEVLVVNMQAGTLPFFPFVDC